jgi:TolB-like protein
MSAEVFISYAAKDRERVLGLVKRLRDAGVTVWIDQAGIDVASMWSQEIVSAIRGCKVMLLSISPHSTESENVVKELALASERKKPIIPVYLEPSDIPETMEYQLAGIQRVEYFTNNEDAAFKAMVRSLAKRGITVDATKAGLEGDDAFEASLAAHGNQAQANRKLTPAMRGLIAMAVVAVVAVAAVFLVPKKETQPALGQAQPTPPAHVTLNTNKLVVLPFKVLGDSGGKGEMFSYGLVSDLTMKLQRVQGLTVISKRSADAQDNTKPFTEIGRALNVGSVITGDVLESDGDVRVNVKLVDANNGAIQWSESYDDKLSGILKLQSQIAQSVAKQLKGVLGVEETANLAKAETTSTEAYELYLQGRKLWDKRTKESFVSAIELFNKAIALDKNFALAYVGIADVRLMESFYSISYPKDSVEKARQASEKALEIKPNLGEALANLAMITMSFDHDFIKAEELFVKAMNANPNHSITFTWGCACANNSGRFAEGLRRAKHAFELDPANPIAIHGVSNSQIFSKNLETAKEVATNALKTHTGFHRLVWDLSICHILEGEPQKAIEVFESQKPELMGMITLYLNLGVAHYKAGNTEKAYQLLVEMITLSQQIYVPKEKIAEFCLVVGLEEQGFYWLNKALEENSTTMVFFAPFLPKKYLNDPRYLNVMNQIKGWVPWSYDKTK